jgi:hypothetical protein
MPACVLYGGISIHIGELAKAEPVIILVGRIGESVNDDGVVVGMVHLAHPRVQLVVGYGGPVHGLLQYNTDCSSLSFPVEEYRYELFFYFF